MNNFSSSSRVKRIYFLFSPLSEIKQRKIENFVDVLVENRFICRSVPSEDNNERTNFVNSIHYYQWLYSSVEVYHYLIRFVENNVDAKPLVQLQDILIPYNDLFHENSP